MKAWVAATISGCVVFVLMFGVILALGANGEAYAHRTALEACQESMVSTNRLLPGGEFDPSEYTISHNYADDSYEVSGNVSARSVVRTAGQTRITVGYRCLMRDNGNGWEAESTDTYNVPDSFR